MADEYIDSVVSLVHFELTEGATSCIDAATGAAWVGVGYTDLSNEVSRFGGTSLYKQQAGHYYFSTPDSADLNMEGYDFTVEAWAYPLELRDGSFIFAKQTDTNRAGFAVGFMANGSLFATCSSGGNSFAGNAEDIAVGVWQHIALARMSGIVRLFVNGVLKHVWSDSTYMKNTAPVTLGVMSVSFSSQAEFIGYIDEFRLSKGQCRYFKDFLPPDQPFTNPVAYPVKPPLSVRPALTIMGRLPAPVPEYFYNDKTGRSVEKPVGFLRHGVPQYLNINTKVPYNNVAYFRFPIAQLLSHLPAPVRDTGLTLGRRDTVYGGAASLKGTLQVRGAPPAPISRTLRLMADDSRTIIYETKSDAITGAYEFPNLSTKFTYTIIALDYMGVYRALIATGQKATYD